jgi:hypothetical protein
MSGEKATAAAQAEKLRAAQDLEKPVDVAIAGKDGPPPDLSTSGGGPGHKTTLPQMPMVTYPNAGFLRQLGAGLMTTVGLLPGLISVPTVSLYLVLPMLGWTWNPGLVSVGGGAAIGAGAWLVLGVLFIWKSDPARVSSGIYRELEARYLSIESRILALDTTSLATAAEKAAYLRATAMRDELGHLFDPKDHTTAHLNSDWVSATGYISAWHHVHRAEEALMMIEECGEVVSAALNDRGRLQGSRFRGRDDTLMRSALAISTLDFTMKTVVGLKVDATPAPTDPEMARVVLVDIKKSVNEYRDGLWESLVYLRRRTIQGLLFVGLTGYLVISVALVMGASTNAVVAASAFYLSGAMIGLFHAAYLEQRRRVAVEDYGLYATRLLLLPVIAGIAGVIGAGLTAFLGAPPLGLGLIDNPDLTVAFSLQAYPLGLVSAAIFGLTPGLLLDRIKALGDDVKTDIAKSDPSGNEKADGQQNSDGQDKSDGQEKADAANNDND